MRFHKALPVLGALTIYPKRMLRLNIPDRTMNMAVYEGHKLSITRETLPRPALALYDFVKDRTTEHCLFPHGRDNDKLKLKPSKKELSCDYR
jgi:hypothetical protein